MVSAEMVQEVRHAVSAYDADEYVYLLGSRIAIVQCREWTFTPDRIRAFCEFRRMVWGADWTTPRWEFGVSAREGDFLFMDGKLQGANLSDTIVIDPGIFRLASTVFPDSDPFVIQNLKTRLWGLA